MIKSLKFNGKYIIMGLCLSVIVLISMYKSTTLDFINESIMYLPLFAIIFSIFMNLELYEYRMEELYYVSNIYKWRTFLIRIINVIAIELIIIILNVLIYLALFDLGFDYESEIGIYFVTTIISFIYFTSVTTFVCGIIKVGKTFQPKKPLVFIQAEQFQLIVVYLCANFVVNMYY